MPNECKVFQQEYPAAGQVIEIYDVGRRALKKCHCKGSLFRVTEVYGHFECVRCKDPLVIEAESLWPMTWSYTYDRVIKAMK